MITIDNFISVIKRHSDSTNGLSAAVLLHLAIGNVRWLLGVLILSIFLKAFRSDSEAFLFWVVNYTTKE